MEENKPTASSLEELKDIRRIMERSSRFVSLSGLSGVAAGICAMGGAYAANHIFRNYYGAYNSRGFTTGDDFSRLKIKLILLGVGVFVLAFSAAFYLTWRKAKKQGLPVWDHTSRRLAWNMLMPLLAGGAFILGMLRYDIWIFVAPACLVFYGLALVNASKYTLSDIRYLGYCEIILGTVNMLYTGLGLWFWAIGFGLLHIVYGIIMWNKYERGN
ncbi:MAG: hypothetical protein HZA79_15080 [Sphingobacteriales bacterium]|nr:hypothetical protein [Sphingobacteriales bacterium]